MITTSKIFTLVFVAFLFNINLASAQTDAEKCADPKRAGDCRACPSDKKDACIDKWDSRSATNNTGGGVSSNNGLLQDVCYGDAETRRSKCNSFGRTSAECRAANELYRECKADGVSPYETQCREQQKDYRKESEKIDKICRGVGASCESRVLSCQDKLNSLTFVGGNESQVAQQYGQIFQSMNNDPLCARAFATQDQKKIEKLRDNAQKKIDKIEEDMPKKIEKLMKDSADLSEKLSKMQKETAETVDKLLDEAGGRDEKVRDTQLKAEIDQLTASKEFKDAAMKAVTEMQNLEEQLTQITKSLPLKIEMDYEKAVAAIATECLKAGRADADARRIEREKKKAGFRYGTDKIVGLFNTTEDAGSPQKRYNIDRRKAEKLCLQDNAPKLEALKKEKQLQIEGAEQKANRLRQQMKLTEITMQDMVDLAKKKGEVIDKGAANEIMAHIRQKDRVLAKASFLQQSLYTDTARLQYESMQNAQRVQSELQQLDQQKNEANMTLYSLPDVAAPEGFYKDFTEAVDSINARPEYEGDSHCCDGRVSVVGGSNSFCSGNSGSSFRTPRSGTFQMPTFGGSGNN